MTARNNAGQSLFPLLAYETAEKPIDYEELRRLSREKALSQKLKFARFREKYGKAIKDANIKSTRKKEQQIESTRSQVDQLRNLTLIEYSITRERTRAYLTSSSLKMKKILEIARVGVRSRALAMLPEAKIKKAVLSARKQMDKRTLEVGIDVTYSRHYMLTRVKAIGLQSAGVKSFAERKIVKRKEGLMARRIGSATPTSRRHDVELLPSPESPGDEVTRRQSTRDEETRHLQSPQINNFRHGMRIARKEFASRVGRTELALKSKSAQTMNEGKLRMNRMQQNIADAKLLFGVDVKFARNNLNESARKLRLAEIVIIQKLAARRKTELRRARGYRKVAAVRNALALIRTLS